MRAVVHFALWLLFLLTLSCEGTLKPEPINYGKDSCAFCLMIVADAGFSAEIKTKKGKVYKFDSIECMVAYLLKNKLKKEELAAVWVADFPSKRLVRLEKVKFLVSEGLRSPMGLNISAFANEEELKEAFRHFGGKVMGWEEVVNYVKEKWQGRIGSST